ncbi:Protein phosphatase PP2A regulatory subunit B [Entomophthora muscae]|uniref:Protein phosphatase PP2A regulatory subunit B n=1 Tax=Entomophthora muscae TaxID=34485 RepID=A0ACC2RNZ9_9FUNG|nr:Protein phosphatase PP2A regulatory subunit B [Entomophthora muscae]
MSTLASAQPASLTTDAAAFKPAEGAAQAPTPAAFPSEALPHPVVPVGPVPASLYVGDLGEYVTESNLFELFNLVGPVASIRVCRDSVTRRSLGYAYVNYHSVTDAERAIETLNHTPIQGKACRVMWSQRDPAFRKVGTGNIFIKNLDPSIDNKALHDTFSAFGKILSCKVVYENGVSKGYGFVHFDKHEDAENAIKNVNGMLLNDLIVYVGFHESSKDRQSKSNQAHATFTNVYVKGLHPSVTSEQLRELFSKHGTVTSCLVQQDADGKSKEFGFVNFEAHESAVSAIDALNEQEHFGTKITVCRAQKKAERENELRKQFQAIKEEKMMKSQGANLYVKNLEDDVDEAKLISIFSPYGTIASCKIMVDEKNKSRGFGFVSFTSPTDASKAVVELNNRMFGNKPLYVNYAQRKEERRSQLEAQRTQIPMGMAAPMYPNAAIFYPPNPNYPPPAQRNMMYPQPNMMPPRPRWNNAQQLMPGQYSPNMNNPQNFQQPRAHRQGRQQNRGNNRNNNSRQNPAQASIPTPVSVPEPAAPASPTGLTAATLAAATPAEQKQMLGEQLFPLIHAINEENAGKITGMLLEMDNDELLHLIENADALDQKVAEALSVLAAAAQ